MKAEDMQRESVRLHRVAKRLVELAALYTVVAEVAHNPARNPDLMTATARLLSDDVRAELERALKETPT